MNRTASSHGRSRASWHTVRFSDLNATSARLEKGEKDVTDAGHNEPNERSPLTSVDTLGHLFANCVANTTLHIFQSSHCQEAGFGRNKNDFVSASDIICELGMLNYLDMSKQFIMIVNNPIAPIGGLTVKISAMLEPDKSVSGMHLARLGLRSI